MIMVFILLIVFTRALDLSHNLFLHPDEYVSYCGTHCDHIVIPDPLKTAFFDGLRKVVAENGGKVIFEDTYVLYLARKPSNRLTDETERIVEKEC